MRSKEVILILMFALVATSLVQAQEIVNLFDNPGFEEGTGTDVQSIPGWNLYVQENATGLLSIDTKEALEGKQCVFIKVTGVPAGGTWNLRFEHTRRFSVKQGETYTMAFWLKGGPGPITLSPSRAEQNAAGAWGNLAQAIVRPTSKWQEYHLTFTSPEDRLVMWQLLISNPGQTYYVDHARCYVGQYVPDQIGPKLQADSPSPLDGATDVPRDAVLGWNPGEFAAAHDVYFGPTFADVNTAGRAAGKGVLAGQGQTDTTFDPPGALAYGQSYYWRVDEVNKAPGNTVFKGNVWSFTVEPYGYPVRPVKTTASSNQAGMGPEKTIDGSGLTGDLHGTEATTMWLSTAVQPAWIQYEFDKVYKLHELQVWNSNQLIEGFLGFGAKSVTIETSTDGTTWTPLANVPQFSRAPGAPGYAANTTVNFGGRDARFVKLTITANWGGVALQTGLAEVRFFYIPVQARLPQPATAAQAVSVDASLDWRPGRQAASHQVYLGTDPNAVAQGTASAKTVTAHGFTPDSLNFGTTYYWKVDEVNGVTYPGAVWNFTTQEYEIIEDFESYTDQPGAEVFTAWVDGLTNSNGSIVGLYPDAVKGTFCETMIIHGGKKSMPFEYNNVKTPFYSEAVRTFDTPQDWTTHGADTLSLYLRGYPVAFADKGNNAFAVTSTGTDIWGNTDQFRFAYKQLSGNGSITARVESLTRSDAWSKAGVMIRETLEAGSKHASTVVTPDNSCSFQRRPITSAASTSNDWPSGTAAVKAPYWVRITRAGNTFTCETAPDGKTWTALGTPLDIAMGTNVYIGLAVTSHNANAYSTAEFSNVATTGTVTGAWRNLSIGVTQLANDPAPLYLVVEDKAGKKKTALHQDPAATTVGAWTEWRIPFSDLAGVNLAAVKKVTLGVGDRSSPKPGGAGKLFVDDLGFGHPIK